MGAVERFAGEAAAYRDWVLHGTDTGPAAARHALLHVTRLLLAALHLPPRDGEEATPAQHPEPDVRTPASILIGKRLPFHCYGEVFDPFLTPPEEPDIRDVADDLADIFAEVNSGLRLFAAGRRADAVWAWGFGFETHWGEHAASAVRALQCWLKAHAPAFLADAHASPDP